MTDAGLQSPVILAFDTSGPFCATALLAPRSTRLDGTRTGPATTRVDEMKKGQAEHLMPMLQEMLASEGLGWRDLSAIGVGVGPGNFTGIRISVSAARGLALGLHRPAIGVSNFEAVYHHADTQNPVLAVVPAPRDQAYVQEMADTLGAPRLIPCAELESQSLSTISLADQTPADTVTAIAEIALLRHRQPDIGRPAPLYVKPPDAAPGRHQAPQIVG